MHDNASQKGCTTLTERAGYSYVVPLVPECEIPALFSHLKQQVLTDALRRLFEYVDSTWVHTDVWPPSSCMERVSPPDSYKQ